MNKRARLVGGFTLLELTVVIVLVAILAGALLKRALYYEEQAERVSVEQTIGILRSAMHMQMAYSLLHPTVKPMSRLVTENPMTWLAELPPNYVGEYAAPKPGEIASGNWYYDTRDRTLVYLPTYDEQLQTGAGEGARLRFRARLSTGNTVGYGGVNVPQNASFEGIVLEPVKPYKWR